MVLAIDLLTIFKFENLENLQYALLTDQEWPGGMIPRISGGKILVYPNRDVDSKPLFSINLSIKRGREMTMVFDNARSILAFDPAKQGENAKRAIGEFRIRLPEYFHSKAQ